MNARKSLGVKIRKLNPQDASLISVGIDSTVRSDIVCRRLVANNEIAVIQEGVNQLFGTEEISIHNEYK